MSCPLVSRLVRAISTAAEPELRAALRAELACYHARAGEFEAAEQLKRELRGEFGHAQNARISIWLICLDALLLWHQEASPAARQRMRAAYLLSKSFTDVKLVPFTSAWMAQMDFAQNRIAELSDALKACFEHLTREDLTAECQVSLIMGDALQICDETRGARAWYERSRRAANSLGDHAAMGAITYNRAWTALRVARLKALSQALRPEDIALIAGEAQSALNYRVLVNLRGPSHLPALLESGVLMMQGRFDEAEPKVRQVLQAPELQRPSALRLLLQSDRALILAQAGRADEATAQIEALPPARPPGPDDQLALAAAQLVAAASACAAPRLAAPWETIRQQALDHHGTAVRGLRQCVLPYADAALAPKTG